VGCFLPQWYCGLALEYVNSIDGLLWDFLYTLACSDYGSSPSVTTLCVLASCVSGEYILAVGPFSLLHTTSPITLLPVPLVPVYPLYIPLDSSFCCLTWVYCIYLSLFNLAPFIIMPLYNTVICSAMLVKRYLAFRDEYSFPA
jgi:hypothetical protein